ncbi:MAG: AAA domain-containing protein [Polyangiales bacterium]
MNDATPFLDFLREGATREGRGNDELMRAVLPLFRQALEHHDEGRVCPFTGIDDIFASRGQLWFHDKDALSPSIDLKAVRALEPSRRAGVDVVDRTAVDVDLEDHRYKSVSQLVRRERSEAPPDHALYAPDYISWEDLVGHQDALTDVFSLGMLLASLALGLDFTEIVELEQFVTHRHQLTKLSSALHPVIAKAIVRMTELDRRDRSQDLRGIIERLERYRDVDERVDESVDFRKLEGFVQADLSSRRKLIQKQLQSRLFDTSKRNRLIWYKPTQGTLDLTEASVPTQLNTDNIEPKDLFLWQGATSDALSKEKSVRLERHLRFEETPYARSTLDKIRSQARRDEAEVGASQLRLVIAFLNWHNLRDAPDDRIRSPLLLIPVKLEKKRGVRDAYTLTPTSDEAEINPVLRHLLHELYELELPERIDLGETDVETFHKAVAAEIARSEPGITLHFLTKPQIRLVQQRARRRLASWRRRSKVSGRGVRRLHGVSYSYSRSNFRPLGLQLFLQRVKPELLQVEELFKSAKAAPPPPVTEESDEETSDSNDVVRSAYQLTEAATGRHDWAVDLTHQTLGNFNYRKMTLVRDFDEILLEDDGHEHPAFDTLFSLDARELSAVEDSDLDPLEPFVVVPADPTQTAALHWARQGKNAIIQGPPGTGKSQTITNLIADFAGQGKRVLFVCEKRAALDVVYHRLSQRGLDELSVLIHDSQSDKKPFLIELGATYERWLANVGQVGQDGPVGQSGAKTPKETPHERRAELSAKLRAPLEALARFSESMNAPADGSEVSTAALIRENLACGEAPELNAEERELLPSHRACSAAKAKLRALDDALVESGASRVLSELPLLWLGSGILDSERPLGQLREGLDAIEEQLDAVDRAREHVRAGATATQLQEALALARQLREFKPSQFSLLDPSSTQSVRFAGAVSEREAAERALALAQDKTGAWKEKLAPSDLTPAIALARRSEALFILFRFFWPAWWTLRSLLNKRYDFAKHAIKPGWVAVLSELDEEYKTRNAVEEQDAKIARDFDISGGVPEFASTLAELRRSDARTPFQEELVGEWSTGDGSVVRALAKAESQINALSTLVPKVFDESHDLPLESLSQHIESMRSSMDLLPELRSPLRGLSLASADIREALRRISLTASQFEAAVAETALDRTYRASRPLARFDHSALERRRDELKENYEAWLDANAAAVREQVRARFLERARLCVTPAAGLNADEKVLKKSYNAGRRVLEREFKKVMRHRSIRELSSGDSGTVLYDLKPIWLMSPLSISDTIPLNEERFDVVIFDEASQIPLEEAVPALYRAPQMIVVGDEMQLPPSKFFASSKRDKGEDEDGVGESHYDLDADSFLSHAARKLPSTMLGWHYRSRSEALIRFSNFAFYDGALLTVPDRALEKRREPIVVESVDEGDANAARITDRPVSYHRLECGVYAARRNAAEAGYIARLVRGLLNADGGQSIGIVAFSEAQQGEIESALSALASGDPKFATALESEYERSADGQLVGLFVKNLENVQGDERDIIILSICYAPAANGKMRMNFGPINKGGGEKRLNVVFTRAKQHMVVVSSISYSAITNEYNEGARCFRRYLQYSEAVSIGDVEMAATVTRALARTNDDDDSSSADPVVDALCARLKSKGFTVTRNIGASEFRVDIGVCRPGDDNLVLGILVDTAGHYALNAPMERYHTRPGVLEAFGWGVEWVLAKDWLADADGCLARIERAYERARAKS